MTTAATAYCFVDTAIGGVDHRNHVARLDQFTWPIDAKDVYTTAFRYTADLLDWVSTHTNDRDRPTVSGYRGPADADGMFFDFDAEGAIDQALADVRRLVQFLHNDYDIPLDAIACSFSGNKGFHVVVPAALFAEDGFTPAENLPARMGALAAYWADLLELRTLDRSIYQHLRLFRVENTRHSKTGLFAVPLTTDELLTLDADAIRTLARHPRELQRPSADDWRVRPELAELWGRTQYAAKNPTPAATRAAGATLRPGSRNPWFFATACSLVRRNTSEAGMLGALRALNATETDEPLPDDELVQLAHDVVTRYQAGDDFRGMYGDAAGAEAGDERPRGHRDEEYDALRARTLAAEAKLGEARGLIRRIGEYVAEPGLGEEVRLIVGLAVAHYQGDPMLQPRRGNRWKLTQPLAMRLCGKASAATAGSYATKLARKGFLPLDPDEEVKWTKPDGTKLRGYVPIYQLPEPDEDANPEAIAAQNATVLLSREKRKQEAARRRGDARRFERCPDCPRETGVVLKGHCAGCDRVLERRKRNVFTTAPVPHPSRLQQICAANRQRNGLQSLESKEHDLTLQTLWTADTPAPTATDRRDGLQTLQTDPPPAPRCRHALPTGQFCFTCGVYALNEPAVAAYGQGDAAGGDGDG